MLEKWNVCCDVLELFTWQPSKTFIGLQYFDVLKTVEVKIRLHCNILQFSSNLVEL